MIASFLAAFSSTLVWSAVIGDLSALGDLLLAAVVAIGTTLVFAGASADWPRDMPPWRVLIPIFAVYSLLMIGIWILIR